MSVKRIGELRDCTIEISGPNSRIDTDTTDAADEITLCGNSADVPRLAAALRAVLLLHSSRPDLIGRPVCEECVEDLGLGDIRSAAYPCPTVQAITEALGGSDE